MDQGAGVIPVRYRIPCRIFQRDPDLHDASDQYRPGGRKVDDRIRR
jgi:hypothetical protein